MAVSKPAIATAKPKPEWRMTKKAKATKAATATSTAMVTALAFDRVLLASVIASVVGID